ncbi:DUF2007 domain-containing protein [Sphingomonas sp. LY54]|uniref:putative signal transducing protein n=1 Tax=Sphingomonas sp. LY54 TaxID=3095343 RepID=UPI002D7807A6|nr:DUF2007 domain-containing protein [Sphingomonas sp. LY54]WRP27319.1 DUF2007 domain-containing protein [Sphingomonas sp. LY54]
MALVEIALFYDSMSAGMARARLAAEGIETILFDQGVAGLGLGMLAPMRLMVEERDRAEAAALLSPDTDE